MSAKPATTIRTAAAYFRSRQVDSSSIDRQRRLIRAYAKRHGFKIVREYCDAGSRGDDLQREGLLSLIADAAETDFDVVLCASVEVLSRLPIEQSTWLFQRMHDAGFEIIAPARGRVDWRELVRPSLLALNEQRRKVLSTIRRFAKKGIDQ